MKTNTRIIMVNWFNHYDEKVLGEEYDQLKEIFGSNESKINCLYDCDAFGVFQYQSDLDPKMKAFDGGLFEPEYHDSMKLFKDEYYEYDTDVNADEVSNIEFFGDLEYQKQLQEIGRQAGDDVREFDRLWTEKFVFETPSVAF